MKTVSEKVKELREEAEKEHLPVMRERTAEFLAAIIAAKKPAQALEIGTCTGVSALCALSAGAQKLTTVEIDSDRADRARKAFAECGYASRVTLIEDDCREALRYLENNSYDLIILDGPKSDLAYQYETCLATLNKGGIIFIDDVLYHGMITADGAPHKQRTIIRNMREFLSMLVKDERVKAEIHEEEDGFAVVEKL